ncbi:hypothetical protein FIBSPDRAFT_876841 [Athelia psychrophila]|uniref:Uncharacterized protein n=1 Tax=Athelia psychrophila TaxID=1759441 RepID=A0A167WH18_9AGAM|nr:hypothetical protein FIBSPDRAFT_876841 [Fibularhizoctonia sp. CBS 109695]
MIIITSSSYHPTRKSPRFELDADCAESSAPQSADRPPRLSTPARKAGCTKQAHAIPSMSLSAPVAHER